MKKILVTGSNGQLGKEFKKWSHKYELDFIFTGKEELDITKLDSIRSFLKENPVDFLINCAAYTLVDKAENESEKANSINNIAAHNLAIACKEHSVKLIHFSTDFVFDGKANIPYKEEEGCRPISVYGKTKRDGELAIIKEDTDALIIRISWLYSSFGNNFVKAILKLSKQKESFGIIFDQIGTPTYAKDLVNTVLGLIKENKWEKGVYHYSNEGVASWYDFASAIKEIKNLNCEIYPIETKDYPLPAKRPQFSIMNKAKIKNDFEIKIPHWRESLSEFFNS